MLILTVCLFVKIQRNQYKHILLPEATEEVWKGPRLTSVLKILI